MKRFTLIMVTCLMALNMQAQHKIHINLKAPRPKVGVVLGGGGAKGAAHIGVLKYLEEIGIPVDYVAGTSMGSIIGGLYALGYTPDQLQQLISNVDWSKYIGNKIDRPTLSNEMRRRNSTLIANIPFSLDNLSDNNSNKTLISRLPSAFVNNSSLINLFNDLCVGYQEQMDFNDLPIPFACVATDMITGKEVVLRHGSVPTAMRASMAIPGVFSPVTIDTALLVDGGLVNNFPADVLKEMGADIIIGIEITSNKHITFEDLQSLPQVFGRLVTNSTNGKREENRILCKETGAYIVPDVSGYGMLSFTPQAIDTLVGRGYQKAQEFHEQLLRIKLTVEQSAGGNSVNKVLHAPRAKNIAVDSYSEVATSTKPNDQGWNLVGNPYMLNLTGLSSESLIAGELVHSNTKPWDGKWINDGTGTRYVTIPDNHFDNYEAHTMSWFTADNPMVNGRVFFVQIAKDASTLTFAAANRASLMPALYAAAKTADVETGIVMSDETHKDEVNFWIKEGKTADYEFNADYPKTPNATNFNIYGVHSQGDLSWIAISPEIAETPMAIGYQVPAAGDYMLSLSETYESDEIEHVFVTDHETSPEITTDLMDQDYVFHVNQAETNNIRFTVSIKLKDEDTGTTTGIDNLDVNSDVPTKFIYQDKMYILYKGVIYDATGKRVSIIKR